MHWLRRVITALLLVSSTLTLTVTPKVAGQVMGGKGTHFVRIPSSAALEFSRLGIVTQGVIDYGAFLWAELDESGFARLQTSGVNFWEDPEAGIVSFNQVRFDPRAQGEPVISTEMSADANRAGFRLVQFMGPTKDEWLGQLQSTGLTVLQYYPHHAYLVWATPEQASAAAGLQAVRWTGLFHPVYKINSDLLKRTGLIQNIDIMFYNDGDILGTLERIARLGANVVQYYPSQADKAFYNAIVEMDASQVEAVARVDTVLLLGYASPEPVLDDEMSSQIMAGNYTAGVPFTGYSSWLASKGVDGSGVIWAIIDTGVDYDHPDLGSHIVGGSDFTGACSFPGEPGSDCSGGGHGTHVAGIVGGNAAAGFMDANGFLYGMGVAPAYSIYAMNSLSGSLWPPTGGWQEHSKRAVLGHAIGGNNSWTTGEGTAHGYQASERTHDLMVRDGNFDTTTIAEEFIEVFSAGNSGPGAMTLTAPKEAKNLIVVASSRNYRAGSIDSISSFSSRGPAVDGRYVPTVATPGEQISSSRNDLGGDCSTSIAGTNNLYAFCSGTSMASPHASGAVALAADWWRTFNAGEDPSPAMAKALLVNGAVDMGAADIPNFNEGWGRINLSNVIDNGASMVYYDQSSVFQNTGEVWTISVGVVDPNKPLKVSLAWSDAPGAVGANPALVNNLDLTVVNGTNTYLGNQFSTGWSMTGGSPDALNNLENVYIQNPADSATIQIQATNLPGDGIPYNGDATDQDFALVCYNCAEYADFTLTATPESQAICAPVNATYSVEVGSLLGYADTVALDTTITPPSSLTSNFTPNNQAAPFSSLLTIGNTGAATAGDYSILITGVAPTSTHAITTTLSLFNATPGAITLISPADGALNQPLQPTFSWEAASQAGSYSIQVATDSAFTNIVAQATGLNVTSFTPSLSLNSSSTYFWRVWADNACAPGPLSVTRSFTTLAAPGDCPVGTLTAYTFNEDFESGATGWSHSGTGDSWGLSSVRAHSGLFSYHANDPSTISDQWLVSPPISLPAGEAPLTLKFWNHQTLENRTGGCYDGGILEVSTNNGASWVQVLDPDLLTDPYDGLISTSTSNPIGGLNAWCGNPQDWLNSIVDLDAYAGQDVRFRFRLGSDTSVGYEGWYIDDVVVQSCVPATYSATLGPVSTLDGVPGSTVVHSFTLDNQGLQDSYTLSVSAATWPTNILTPSPLVISALGQAQVQVEVQVPAGMPRQEVIYGTDVFTLTAQSTGDPGLVLETSGTTNSAVHPGVSLAPSTFSRSGLPGQVVTQTVVIQNTGDYTDTFTLAVTGNNWAIDYPPSSGELGAGSSVEIQIHVTMPDQIPDAVIASDSFTLTATSSLDILIQDQAQRTTNANVLPGVKILPDAFSKAGMPGEVITYTYSITNSGDYTDSFTLSLSNNLWQTSAPAQTPWLGVGESIAVEVSVEIPLSPLMEAVIASDTFQYQAVSYWDSLIQATATGTTTANVNPAVVLTPDTNSSDAFPGTIVTYTYAITNTGDYTDTFIIGSSGLWQTALSTANVGPLRPGESQAFTLWVSVPIAADQQESDVITVEAVSALDNGVSASATATTTAVWRRMYLPIVSR